MENTPKFCYNCGGPLPPGARFCAACGQSAAGPAVMPAASPAVSAPAKRRASPWLTLQTIAGEYRLNPSAEPDTRGIHFSLAQPEAGRLVIELGQRNKSDRAEIEFDLTEDRNTAFLTLSSFTSSISQKQTHIFTRGEP